MAEDAPIPHELEQAAAQAGPKSSHRSTAEAGSAAGQQEAPAEHVMVTLKFLIPLFLDLNFHPCLLLFRGCHAAAAILDCGGNRRLSLAMSKCN